VFTSFGFIPNSSSVAAEVQLVKLEAIMVYKATRLEPVVFQKQFEEALNLAMAHIGVNYSEALELVFMPISEQGGNCVADLVRRGQLLHAKAALVELIEAQKRRVVRNNKVYKNPSLY
jgi:hypothetical protein